MKLLWKEDRSVIVDFPLFLQELDLSMENTSDDISLYYSLHVHLIKDIGFPIE